ncbi:MAG: glycosyl hydrolase family 65 protein [Deltaproteobacteria bacterium]|nr:glycosyl hydrolase family 65 protein [Deltaproteobacteria bacterium]
MKDWTLRYEGFDPAQEGRREALCTLGNGYFATRGAAPEATADGLHYPGTYVAGCYNRLTTELAGRAVEHEDLVNLPNWLPLTFRTPGGDWLDLRSVEILSYVQELDLRQGVLSRTVRVKDREGRRTRIESRRLVHMRWPHLGALETTLIPESWEGPIELRAALDGRVTNRGVQRYRDLAHQHLVPVESGSVGPDTIALKMRTTRSEIGVAQAARTRVLLDGRLVSAARRVQAEPGYVAETFSAEVGPDRPLTVEKLFALYTSRDPAITECGLEARTAVARADDFEALRQSHAQAWARLWQRFDIEIEENDSADGDLPAALVLRLHAFHLLQTVSPHTIDLDVGVPARGLHGEAYRGHVFWDELFVFPFANFRMPEITRSLLRYRHRRLGEALAAARAAGYSGAMYPWQSGSNGRDETPVLFLNPRSGRWMPDHSQLQRHVGAAIAYNVWQYYQATADAEFLSAYGAEMVLEIARFWASLSTYNEDLGRYEILGVMGPDEYHDADPGSDRPGLRNNAYTNLMAAWVLWRAADMLQALPHDRQRELCATLGLTPEEISRWNEISRKLRLVFHGDDLLSQFEGYEQLEEFDWDSYRRRYGSLYRLDFILELEGKSPNRYKLSKQADVLMLFYLFSAEELGALFERLGYPFDPASIPRTIEYYLRRAARGSSLSRVTDAWVLARSDRRRSWHLFVEALRTDVADIQGGTTAEGIHLGAMAGTVDLVQRCYTGLELRGDVLWLNPRLPDDLRRLRLSVRYRGHSLELEVSHEALTVSAARCEMPVMKFGLRTEVHELTAGEVKVFPL